jgi:hypothetical protein
MMVSGITDGTRGAANFGAYDVFAAPVTGVPEATTSLLLAAAALGPLFRRNRS